MRTVLWEISGYQIATHKSNRNLIFRKKRQKRDNMAVREVAVRNMHVLTEVQNH